ncbi:RDD family protein [Corynebacterium sp. sy017]|uniref:RDD family protein n=1 Tax=unclassified Corynebacterium TaxID=2624378 RepID=UPI0011864FBC|nr:MULTISPECIES: RDD family protein [unclassified Corynebacterium]MBP3088286.1 RDD family protein [Corynebacterium sp. sy017]TSD91610.1 RDD family protein [Corynebacterium sp. SY003]
MTNSYNPYSGQDPHTSQSAPTPAPAENPFGTYSAHPYAMNSGAYSHNYPGGLPFTPASVWHRIGAYVIDSIIIGVAAGILISPIYFIVITSLSHTDPDQIDSLDPQIIIAGIIIFIISILFSIAGIFYRVYFDHKKQGTLGKKALGLAVVTHDGSSISKKQAYTRSTWYIIMTALSFIPVIGSISTIVLYILAIVTMDNPLKQHKWDQKAGVLVIKNKNY